MPHASIPGIHDTFLMIEVLKSPLEYDAPDNQPVDVVFCTLGPPAHRDTHINLLGAVSRMVLETEFLEELRDVDDPAAVIELISQTPR